MNAVAVHAVLRVYTVAVAVLLRVNAVHVLSVHAVGASLCLNAVAVAVLLSVNTVAVHVLRVHAAHAGLSVNAIAVDAVHVLCMHAHAALSVNAVAADARFLKVDLTSVDSVYAVGALGVVAD